MVISSERKRPKSDDIADDGAAAAGFRTGGRAGLALALAPRGSLGPGSPAPRFTSAAGAAISGYWCRWWWWVNCHLLFQILPMNLTSMQCYRVQYTANWANVVSWFCSTSTLFLIGRRERRRANRRVTHEYSRQIWISTSVMCPGNVHVLYDISFMNSWFTFTDWEMNPRPVKNVACYTH